MGMVARSTKDRGVSMDLDDVSVEMVPNRDAADVLLTASFVRRSISTGRVLDAHTVMRSQAAWRIARITAIDTLR
jgi:hypothetical protein